MRLATRLSAFFLAALAVVLLSFSTAIFVTAWGYLHYEVDERLTAAIAVLAAVTEIHPGGVEWEPEERELPLGQDSGPDRLRWMVHDGEGHRIDRSRNLNDANLTLEWRPTKNSQTLPRRLVDRQGRSWRIVQRRLRAGGLELESGSDAALHNPRPRGTSPGVLYPSLMLTVAAPIDPVERTLTALGWFLAGLSIGVWLLAASLDRWMIRRAISPLSRMVDSARGLDAADLGWSLPPAGTNDELDDLGRAFNDLLGRLQVAYERQRRFSSDASHQLRTPLTALVGQIEVALRRDRPVEEYRRVLALVRGQAGQLAQIVEALLFLGRADAEAGLPDTTTFDLRGWIVDHVDQHMLGATIEIDLEGALPARGATEPLLIRAHSPLLGQLVENLIDNAAKYGRPDGKIVLRVRDLGKEAEISVIDDGPGIEPDDLGRVFEPFFRAARARRIGRPGVGLGLSIVQRIAGAFGGSIHVLSEPGQGTTFVVRLPKAPTMPRSGIEVRPRVTTSTERVAP